MDSIILIGRFHEIIELLTLSDKKIFAIIDKLDSKDIHGIKILGDDEYLKKNFREYVQYSLVITPDNPAIRKKLFNVYRPLGFEFEKIISPRTTISPSSKINQGSIVQSGVNISANSTVGKFVKLNSFCNVMHDVQVGDFSTIAPNAVILGNVKIGENCYIGANATLLPGVKIGNGATVGAGAVVTRNVKDGMIVKGNPAK